MWTQGYWECEGNHTDNDLAKTTMAFSEPKEPVEYMVMQLRGGSPRLLLPPRPQGLGTG